MGSFNSDLPQFGGFIAEFPTAISAAVMLMVTTAILFAVDPLLGFIAVATIPAVVLVVAVAGPGVHARADDLQSGTAAVTETVEESLENIVLVKSFGLEDARITALEQVGGRLVANAVAYERTQATLVGASGLIPAAAIGAGLLIGGDRVIAGRMSLGELVAFTTWMALYTTIVETLVQRAGGFIRFRAAVRRVETLIAEATGLSQPASAQEPAITGDLVIQNATLEDAGRTVLTATSLVIPHGSRVLVTGPSGSGKSALLALLARHSDPASGVVTWAGQDLRELDLSAYRRRVALVGESRFLFNTTVRENLTFSCPEAKDAEIQEALQLAGAEDVVAALPAGLDTSIGATGRDLSGGQRQRLALARALLSGPSVLLLDDALSAVDGATEQAILANLSRWNGTVVFATHRPEAIPGDQLVRVSVERGQVMTEEARLAADIREAAPSGRLLR